MKKIAVVTGTRAEYGYLKPLMDEIQKDDQLELIPIITGMHLLGEFGNTHEIVEKDFPNSIKIPMNLKGDSLKDMAFYLSSGIKNIASYLEKSNVDILVVLGDRSEALAAALAVLYLNIPIAHINGGDVTGGMIDEQIRHALTKISHIHFAHTKENADRVIKMGEDTKRVFVVGALTLDAIFSKKLLTKKEVFKKYNLNPDKKTFLVVQHPITTLKDYGFSQMKELMESLDYLKEQTVLLYPNCDAGGKKIIDLIKKYEKKDYIHIFKNIPHKDYLSIMKSSDLMIGNSSSGIIEAPSFKTPVINIGERQKGRSRSQNIIDIKPEKKQINKTIDYVLTDNNFNSKVKSCNNKFGDGKSSKKIVKILKDLKSDEDLIKKQISYKNEGINMSEDRFKNWQPPIIEDRKLHLKYYFLVHHKDKLEIGEKTDIGTFTYINAKYGVKIEKNVQIGSHCSIYSLSTIDDKKGKITIKENARIGTHSTIMPAVTIGKNALVGAYSFVNKNIPDNTIAFGVPAEIKKKR